MSGFRIDAAQYNARHNARPGLPTSFWNASSALIGDEARFVATDALDFLAKVHRFLPRAERTCDSPICYAPCAEIRYFRGQLYLAKHGFIFVREHGQILLDRLLVRG